MRDHLLIYINGRPVRVGGDDAFLSLSDYLRTRQRLTGTKVVCAEGDCGSCSVLLGRVVDCRMRYAAVTSCIQMMLQLDATHVVTIEGLREGQALNPIQQAMVACQGTQCGFCTPGFVVAMQGLDAMADEHAVRRGLVGNLCRCTGYDSIIRAALAADRTGLKSIDALYPPGPIVAALMAASGEPVLIESSSRRAFKPISVEQTVHYRQDHPDAVVIAGGTDLGVLQNKRTRLLVDAVSVAGLSELHGIEVDDDAISVGAAASLSDLEAVAIEHIPELGAFMAWFGSPLIKNAGTLAGNLVTGSPIGDTLPALMALGATVEIVGHHGRRIVSLDKFYVGYRKTVLAPEEIVVRIRIPRLPSGDVFKLYKVSRRKDLDISSFGAAIRMTLVGDVIERIHIAYGGVGPMVLRMSRTEAVLQGRPATFDVFEQAAIVARDEVTPISDVRGSDTYRRTLAGNILLRFWHETLGNNGDEHGMPPSTPASPHGLPQPVLLHNPERQG
jgi:xanthine dehydrogenase small subunit